MYISSGCIYGFVDQSAVSPIYLNGGIIFGSSDREADQVFFGGCQCNSRIGCFFNDNVGGAIRRAIVLISRIGLRSNHTINIAFGNYFKFEFGRFYHRIICSFYQWFAVSIHVPSESRIHSHREIRVFDSSFQNIEFRQVDDVVRAIFFIHYIT